MHASREQLNSEFADGHLQLRLAGRMDVDSSPDLWRRTMHLIDHLHAKSISLDLAEVSYCDGSGVALFAECRRRAEEAGGEFKMLHMSEDVRALMDLYGTPEFHQLAQEEGLFSNVPDAVGLLTHNLLEKTQILVDFLGQVCYQLARLFVRPSGLRLGETLKVAEKTGANALPIIALIGFLLGLIMAFQSAVPMKQFGVEIFVADLVALSLLRELGPLITAVILAGRSGSAFAAELGTMKVNEELDALVTMGLEPARFLIIPRILAAISMMPFLVIFFNLMGLIGGGVVILSFGYPLIVYVNQVTGAVDLVDFIGGLAKSFVFAGLVAGIGCFQGMQTGSGAGAVGDSTTRAVVQGIILIAVADGVFAVLFYFLEL
ncbi:MAG: ABC transporter permease [Spirochaetales bacterium]|nr:ABC transporter permease [Leptospiraceae bacterium]MCP5483258.1 ABC transporter permease [Spirochaetales bacterium]